MSDKKSFYHLTELYSYKGLMPDLGFEKTSRDNIVILDDSWRDARRLSYVFEITKDINIKYEGDILYDPLDGDAIYKTNSSTPSINSSQIHMILMGCILHNIGEKPKTLIIDHKDEEFLYARNANIDFNLLTGILNKYVDNLKPVVTPTTYPINYDDTVVKVE